MRRGNMIEEGRPSGQLPSLEAASERAAGRSAPSRDGERLSSQEAASTRGVRRFLLVGVVVGALSALPAAAQPGEEPGAPPPVDALFGEEIDVRVVNLEVVVEDGDGERVRGLGREDFRVYVDGREVEVDYFTEVSDGRAGAGSGEAPPAAGEGGPVATNYVLFVDDDHTMPSFRRPVLYGFRDSLSELRPRDQVAVVVQSGNRLELLSPFTKDREATRAALAELDRGDRFGGVLRSTRFHRDFLEGGSEGQVAGLAARSVPGGSGPSSGLMRRSDVRAEGPVSTWGGGGFGSGVADAAQVDGTPADRVRTVGGLLDRMSPDSMEAEARGSILVRDLTLAVNAVVSTMRALERPEGRKVLLLLPGRWPSGEFRPGGRGTALRSDLDLLNRLIDTANLLGYTLYPLDQQAGAPDVVWWQNLRYMARDTGGQAFMAGRNVDALARVSVDTSSYYWLGFVPDYRRDDRTQEVDVQVLQPGVQVRARRGYVDLSRNAEADMEAQRALLFPSDAEARFAVLEAWVGPPRRLSRRKMAVPIDIEIPLGMFAALPYGDEFIQRLEVRFATIDGAGWRAEQPAIPLEVRSDALPGPDAVFEYHAEVTLRDLAHTVIVTVHDPVSRQTATARVEVAP